MTLDLKCDGLKINLGVEKGFHIPIEIIFLSKDTEIVVLKAEVPQGGTFIMQKLDITLPIEVRH